MLTIKLNPSLNFLIFVAHGRHTRSEELFNSFCQQGFPSFDLYLITLYLSCVCLRVLSFPVCADWPNSDSLDSREPRGVLGAAFKFLRHRCKLSPLYPSHPPPPRELARRLC